MRFVRYLLLGLLSAAGAISAALTPAQETVLFGGVQPTLNLNFLNGVADSRITFSGGANGTRVDASGNIVAATTPRFDHDPTSLAPKGLLIEEARTNSIRNNTMVGAVNGAIGAGGASPTNWSIGGGVGLTTTIVGTGTENGIAYLDVRLSGTTGGTFATIFPEASSVVAATNAQAWSASLYTKLVGGSLANVTTLWAGVRQQDSGAATLSDLVAIASYTPTSMLTRSTGAVTTNNASIAYVRPFFGFVWSSGVAIDFTLRIGLPQLEQGAFATSVIQTSSAAVTRTADSAVMTGANFMSWYRQDQGTFVVSGDHSDLTTNSGRFLFAIDAGGGASDSIRIDSGAGANLRGVVIVGGATQAAVTFGTVTANTAYKTAFSYAANNFSGSLDGATPVTDSAGTLPTLTQIRLGGNFAGTAAAFLNGHIRTMKFYPRALPASTLQRYTISALDWPQDHYAANDAQYREAA